MGREAGVGQALEQLNTMCPAGFAIALHIKFTSSRYLFQAYSPAWIDYYSAHGLVMRDPTVLWGFENTGHVRWSTLDAAGNDVMSMAAKFGLNFGFTAALVEHDSRSVASFARSDREFTDEEMATVSELLGQLHEDTLEAETLSPEDHASLKRLSILLTRS